MKVITSGEEFPLSNTKTVGFVPTMGALHLGHLSLIKESVQQCQKTVVSIYLNPLQFNSTEDLDKYPIQLEQDLELCRRAGVSAVWLPLVDEMPQTNLILPEPLKLLTASLCGRTRFNHFEGVYTIVKKLFETVQPTHAFFGEKDFQQSVLIQNMITVLNLDISIELMPTYREPSGLAMSSRNQRLSAKGKQVAVGIYKSLVEIKKLCETQVVSVTDLVAKVTENLKSFVDTVDYVEVVSSDNLTPTENLNGAVVAVAVFLEGVRLIDNIRL